MQRRGDDVAFLAVIVLPLHGEDAIRRAMFRTQAFSAQPLSPPWPSGQVRSLGKCSPNIDRTICLVFHMHEV